MIDYSKLHAQLLSQLALIKSGDFECIEYGDGAHVGGYASYLRVYYMDTAGGKQFGVKTVSSHVEGSGAYFPDEASCIDYVMNQVMYYHRPLNKLLAMRLEKLAAKGERPELGFNCFTKDEMRASRGFAADLVAYRMRS